MADPIVSTYSIVAADLEAGRWGVAVQSKFLSVGSVVPWAEPHVGAIATQAYANPRYGPNGLQAPARRALRPGGRRPADGEDEGRDQRQLGIVDGKGNAATYTGQKCMDWAGGRTGAGYAAQGNILVSGGDGRRDGGDLRRKRRPTARRTPDRLPRRSAGRPEATAAGSNPRRSWSSSATAGTRGCRTSSSSSAWRTTSARSRSCVASTSCTKRSSDTHRAASGSTSTRLWS